MDEKDSAMFSAFYDAEVDDPAFLEAFNAFFPRYQAWWKDESVQDEFAKRGSEALDTRFIIEPDTIYTFAMAVGPCRALEALDVGDPDTPPKLAAVAATHVETCEKCKRAFRPETAIH